uniref:Ribosomal protein S2 n=1 Tax=Zygnema circumcarinatum TaxID=35869 RepID=A0A6N0GXI8_ZYGCR|nr:ribosomal protein S2 [Zygnema circumcarinatum]QKQ14684.1 ribosomal protein S2 [Zygnema circumcarinatum]WEL36329.1 ribosomal protein S2 [Zygnema circumcarinatum]
MFRSKLLIMQKLLNTSAHLGYRTAQSNYQPYLYGFRNEIAILDLDKTLVCLRRACSVIELIIRSKGHILLVNTNVEYNNIVQETAIQTRQSYINHKWIGGLLTNWNHMQNVQGHFKLFAGESVSRLHLNETLYEKAALKPLLGAFARTSASTTHTTSSKVFAFQAPARVTRITPNHPTETRRSVKQANEGSAGSELTSFTVKQANAVSAARASSLVSPLGGMLVSKSNESSAIQYNNSKNIGSQMLLKVAPRFKKMQKCFEGIVAQDLPDCVIVFNANLNFSAIKEAKRLQIPIIALVDSNVSNQLHNMISFPIPANADCLPFIYLFCNCIFKTILYSQQSFFDTTRG